MFDLDRIFQLTASEKLCSAFFHTKLLEYTSENFACLSAFKKRRSREANYQKQLNLSQSVHQFSAIEYSVPVLLDTVNLEWPFILFPQMDIELADMVSRNMRFEYFVYGFNSEEGLRHWYLYKTGVKSPVLSGIGLDAFDFDNSFKTFDTIQNLKSKMRGLPKNSRVKIKAKIEKLRSTINI